MPALAGMLVALLFALVFGAGEAQAQGRDGVSRGGGEPAGEVTGKADAPVDSGSAPRSTGGPASEDAPAHATGRVKSYFPSLRGKRFNG